MHVAWLPLIPLLPLAGFVVNGILSLYLRGDRPAKGAIVGDSRTLVSIVGCGAPLLSLALALACYVRLSADAAPLETVAWSWLQTEWFKAPFAFRIDRLGAVMCLVVTGVGSLIHIYSTAYMSEEKPGGFARYFAYLNLFTFSMLVLVTAANLPLMFLGWEGVGLCSYLLIGFWYDDLANAKAGKKAFVVNRVGDAAFILGMLLLAVVIGAPATLDAVNPAGYPSYEEALASHIGQIDEGLSPEEAQALATDIRERGPLDFHVVNAAAPHLAHGTIPARIVATESTPSLGGKSGKAILAAAALLLFLGACGKSAQIPLYVWLPDAMAGPTPVSALIHAATMVTAGVYMIARLNGLFSSVEGVPEAIAMVGAMTAVFAATIALAQNDLKKVLAYSTISQLGYMFVAVGAGAFDAGIFHLVTHAFFKALLFLGAGAVLHALHHPSHPHGVGDMRLMGGLLRRMPLTFACFLIGGLALSGLPPFAGFFSKDAILFGAYSQYAFPHDAGHGPNPTWLVVWLLGVVGAFLTAIYTTRMIVLTFFGTPRFGRDHHLVHAHEHAHDPKPAMAWPLAVLMLLAAVGGFLGIPEMFAHDANKISHFLQPVWEHAAAAHHDEAIIAAERWCAIVGVLAAAAGVFLALGIWGGRERAEVSAFAEGGALRRLYVWVHDKYYIDELYDLVFVRGIRGLSRLLWRRVDVNIIDEGAVEGVGEATRSLSEVVRQVQTGYLGRYALYFALGVVVILLSLFAQGRASW